MKTLDKYIVRSFLITAALFFVAMIALRIVGDLFVNIDEFAEVEVATFGQKVLHIGRYYAYQSLVYFVELGGLIIVASATFTLAVMNHTNELTAMLAAGVSLHRVTLPIVICAMVMGGLVIFDQELIIPRVAGELVVARDEKPETREFPVKLMDDGSGSIWFARKFYANTRTMLSPAILIRDGRYRLRAFIAGEQASPAASGGQNGWVVSDARLIARTEGPNAWPHKPDCQKVWSRISPLELLKTCRESLGRDVPLEDISSAEDLNVFDETYGLTIRAKRFVPAQGAHSSRYGPWTGRLEEPRFIFTDPDGRALGQFQADSAQWKVDERGDGYWALSGGKLFYPSDMTAKELILRESGNWLDYMSTFDLSRLIQMRRVSDRRAAEMVKHTRFTAPINNLVMLLLGLPFILSRERNLKASATLCMLTVMTFFAFVFICRYMGLNPLLAAWLPIFIFGPVAILMFDAVKT